MTEANKPLHTFYSSADKKSVLRFFRIFYPYVAVLSITLWIIVIYNYFSEGLTFVTIFLAILTFIMPIYFRFGLLNIFRWLYLKKKNNKYIEMFASSLVIHDILTIFGTSKHVTNLVPYQNIAKGERYDISKASKLLIGFLPSYFTGYIIMRKHPFIFIYTQKENLYRVRLKKKMKLERIHPGGSGQITDLTTDELILDIDDFDRFYEIVKKGGGL